jgi:hypothetical protein
VRLVDTVFRQGHLSERALTEALMTGERPLHLDRCDLCAHRADELGRWLDDLRTTADEAADRAFSAERLAIQHSQILRKLEQADEPARVIAFPKQSAPLPRTSSLGRRVAAGWVGVAAAAGIIVGVLAGQLSVRLVPAVDPAPATARVTSEMTESVGPRSGLPVLDIQAPDFLELDLEAYTPEPLLGIDEQTPKLIPSRYTATARY